MKNNDIKHREKIDILLSEFDYIVADFKRNYLSFLPKIDQKKATLALEKLKSKFKTEIEEWVKENNSTKFFKTEISPFHNISTSSKLHMSLPRECEICREKRVFHIAHIIPKKLNGSNNIDNLLRLCANCHALFDRLKLTKRQLNKINWKIKSPDSYKYVKKIYGVRY